MYFVLGPLVNLWSSTREEAASVLWEEMKTKIQEYFNLYKIWTFSSPGFVGDPTHATLPISDLAAG